MESTDYKPDEVTVLATLFEQEFGFGVAPHKLTTALARAWPAFMELGMGGLGELVGCLRAHEVRLWETLIPFLTVKETYFLREPRQLANFARLVGQGVRRSGVSPPLQILSAGCATGEEAYTLAILLADAGVVGQIWGVDVDAAALVTARAAVYGPHAFRGVPDEWRAQHFEQVAPGRWVKVSHRKPTQFKKCNLARLEASELPMPFDAIFCRNVLIYFDRQTQLSVVGRLVHLLRPTGVLFLGHSEVFLDRASQLGLRYDEALTGYRRKEAE